MKFRKRSSRFSDIKKAREAQLVEQNIEAIWVISSSLISSKIKYISNYIYIKLIRGYGLMVKLLPCT